MQFTRSFPHHFWMVLSLLAAGFFASGAISWIAANWSLFGKAEKFGLVEGLFALSLFIGVSVYVREVRRSKPVFQSAVWLFLTAVLIGGLFALIGQVYQTGANAWQLFAVWAVLQLPLLWALPNPANGLLWLVTLNTAATLALLLNGQSLKELLWVVALNFPLFILAERFADKFYDRRRILAHLLLVWLLVLFVIGGLIEPTSRPAFWAVGGGLIWHYRRYYSCLILGFGYGVVEANLMLVKWLDSTNTALGDGLFLFTLINLSAAVFAAVKLNKRHSRVGSVLLALLVLMVTVSLLLFCFLVLNIDNEHILSVLALGVFGSAFFIRHNRLREAAFALAVAFGTGYVWIFWGIESYSTDIVIAISLALFAFIYYRENGFWLRVLLTLAALFILMIRFLPNMLGYYGVEPFMAAYYIYLLLPLLCLLAFTRSKPAVQAAAWGILLFLLGEEILQAVNFGHFFANIETGTEPRFLPDLFHAITYNAFRPEQISLRWAFALLSAFSPLWLGIWLITQRHIQGFNAMILLLAALLLSVGFAGMPIVGLLFGLLLTAYLNRSYMLFGVSVVSLLAFLTLFYYNLTLSLLYKSFLLMGEGILLGVLVLCLRQTQPKAEKTPAVKIGKRVPVMALITLLTTLGLANFSIWRFEDILQHGEKIVLRLAPLDPRSLMQGDYMVLNYEILSGLNNIDTEEWEKQYQGYIKLYTHNGVDEFCGYTLSSPPTQFEQCRKNVYLPFKIQQSRITMAGQDFFFPEGQREHFEQAEYGEFRFKDGKLLLLRLLDKEMNILERQ